MGQRGETRTGVAKDVAAEACARLEGLGAVTSKGMFGGYGLFLDGLMFGLVNRTGEVYLRVDDQTRPRFEAAGSARHGKMPYYAVPGAVWDDAVRLHEWASTAVEAAQRTAKR